jgi:cytoskeletal protein CcmA (bactofilin family)
MSENFLEHTEFNVIGLGTHLSGQIALSGHTTIYGKIEGKIKAQPQQITIFERSSEILGDFEGGHLEIHGIFIGQIISSGIVSLKPSARVEGSIQSQQMIVYPGALLNLEAHAG